MSATWALTESPARTLRSCRGPILHTEADFYLTARGRLGFVADHWLFFVG